jgi:MOSC domain-containing protein YiiM
MAPQAVDHREQPGSGDPAPRAGDRAKVIAVCLSPGKGTVKTPQAQAEIRAGHGFVGDAHAGDWHRQVSLLSVSSIEKMKALGLDVGEGSFAENLTIDGLDVYRLPVGAKVRVGDSVLIEITQIGKECHTGCAIFKAVGKCVMPREGVFARVVTGGVVRPGDTLEVVSTGGVSTGVEKGDAAP